MFKIARSDIIFNIVTPKKLAELKRELLEIRKSPHGRKPRLFESMATRVGRVRDNRGKEPTYVRKIDPALSPPLSIPNHGGKDLKSGTARSIIDALLDDISEWEIYNDQNSSEDNGSEDD